MLSTIRSLFSAKMTPEQQIALALYNQVVTAAREPALYAKAGVPDTLEGRVECIGLHAFCLFRRMSGEERWDDIGGALSDEIVSDFDRSLREMGIGDMSIGKKVKRLAQIFFGRFDAYWGAVNGHEGAEEFGTVLRRGVFQEAEVPDAAILAMEVYVDRQTKHLFQQAPKDILRGRLSFAPAGDVFDAIDWSLQPQSSSEDPSNSRAAE